MFPPINVLTAHAYTGRLACWCEYIIPLLYLDLKFIRHSSLEIALLPGRSATCVSLAKMLTEKIGYTPSGSGSVSATTYHLINVHALTSMAVGNDYRIAAVGVIVSAIVSCASIPL